MSLQLMTSDMLSIEHWM